MQPGAGGQRALDIGDIGLDRRKTVGDRRRRAKQQRIDVEQDFRRLVGGAAHHHAVDMAQMLLRRGEIHDAAVDRQRQIGMGSLQLMDQRIVERGNVAVVLRAQALQPGLAGMDDDRRRARRLDARGQREQRLARLLRVDPDAAFDGHGDGHRARHRPNALADQRRLAHQAGAEAPALHAVRRAAAVQVDLIIAEVGADAGGLRKALRVSAAQLQRERMLERVEPQQSLARPEHHRVRRHHFGIEARAARQQAMEDPAMPVRPVHHRRDGESSFQFFHLITLFIFQSVQCAIGTIEFFISPRLRESRRLLAESEYELTPRAAIRFRTAHIAHTGLSAPPTANRSVQYPSAPANARPRRQELRQSVDVQEHRIRLD